MIKRHFFLAAVIAAIGCARSQSFGEASFNGQPYSINIPAHITTLAQSVNASTNITIQHGSPCTLRVSVVLSGDETLTCGSSTLDTFYMLTGNGLQNPDNAWITAATFLTRIYTLPGTGQDVLSLSLKADAPANKAPDAGVYAASIVLTVTW